LQSTPNASTAFEEIDRDSGIQKEACGTEALRPAFLPENQEKRVQRSFALGAVPKRRQGAELF
jgi:hypothetical protein